MGGGRGHRQGACSPHAGDGQTDSPKARLDAPTTAGGAYFVPLLPAGIRSGSGDVSEPPLEQLELFGVTRLESTEGRGEPLNRIRVRDTKQIHEAGGHAHPAEAGSKAEEQVTESSAQPDTLLRFCGGWRAETWILKVDRVICPPDTSPTLPNGAEIQLVFVAYDHHVKGVAVLVGGATWWSCGVTAEALSVPSIQARLFGACPQCGCYPRLYTRAGRKVEECACGFLEFRDQPF